MQPQIDCRARPPLRAGRATGAGLRCSSWWYCARLSARNQPKVGRGVIEHAFRCGQVACVLCMLPKSAQECAFLHAQGNWNLAILMETTGTTLRIYWCRGREWCEQFADRRAVVTQTVADRWRELNWGEQLARHSASWLGHMCRAIGWSHRMLHWWTAEADATAWHLRALHGERAHPTIVAERRVCCVLCRAERQTSEDLRATAPHGYKFPTTMRRRCCRSKAAPSRACAVRSRSD